MGLMLADKIENMVKEGTKVRCVALRAASAAFMMWAACSERVAIAYGRLLFHYPYQIHGDMPMRMADYVANVEKARIIEDAYRAHWNKHFGAYVSTSEQEAAARSEHQFLGIEMCNKWAHGFCTVIYKYDYLENK